MSETVKEDSLLTLHYRLATADDTELVSTFGAKPATLQLGSGELAPVLERHLIGLPAGQRTVFLLEPEQAFGPHNPQLMQRFARSALPDAGELREMALIEFKAPGGAAYTGLVRELTEEDALIDFNHPLAGKAIRFEVDVIGIL
ncbi:MAG: FKBP-type peptidyl-prolyl cis-trans isomerase [Rhodocyclaceae bacterium]|jgi:FKBP-type peptidyl-prolyl cis-trans isomerase SlpA|nr:FKBP-type 16 kDa peptidyl-prolyl cis-trans isomerase [Rhodocyclaceae bacterium]MBZ0143337.1 FKBP-type peptidyl-prolyl cis-trans isomerase [Rhodocyclaceae bacterium]MCC6879628.1 FKBP-type peptidyl-prolyl cis-trans isomerase [Rhodocyclaceae bacterium]MCL4679954.1 FKBP-type peptidyl-prolyl cis-trans isomerase [Rhodocyclaceae bacterium]